MDNGPFSCSRGICLINNGRRVSGSGGNSVCSRGEMRLRAIFWGIKINEKKREKDIEGGIYSRISSARTSRLGPNSVSSAQNLAIIGRQSVFMVA